jgi:pullulanase
MKKIASLLALLSFASIVFCQPLYNGRDLGVRYSPFSSTFKVWAPTATAVKLRLYATGEGDTAIRVVDLEGVGQGVWRAVVAGNLVDRYYTFQPFIDGKWQGECPDIYARAVGVNGQRGMIVDMGETNPPGWAQDKRPPLAHPTDIILYELHIRDLSMDTASGILHKGKFLGLTETGTRSPQGEVTGLDHIRELGVTHIHLLPSFDFGYLDEKQPDARYNWGYAPVNYDVPEGSYSTDPYDGRVRIREFKQMVKTLHDKGLRVVLDVVYNHTADVADSRFTQFYPGYFYRLNPDGSYSNATGCQNETASEKAMMRKFMVESVAYWANEYHLDGFRFDLMGVHDLATMNAIADTLHKIDPTLFMYGEGWDAGHSPLPAEKRALKKNMREIPGVAAFSDDIRDAIKGGMADLHAGGFVSGETKLAESIKFGIVAATRHPQIDYAQVNDSKAPWALEPSQAITYASCHDDNCLWDRLQLSNPAASEADLIRMDKLAAAIVLTSQGVPFIYAGEEMLRTKKGVANSYDSPDSINAIDWARKTRYKNVVTYYEELIALRKHHPAFRMPTAEGIRNHLQFLAMPVASMVGYVLKDHANGDSWKSILVYLNGGRQPQPVTLPPGDWVSVATEEGVREKGIGRRQRGVITVAPTAAYILYQL